MDFLGRFYVAYSFRGLRYLAVVTAPGRPAKLEFADYSGFHQAMDALGEPWSMRGEVPDPLQYAFDDVAVWRKQLAEVKEIVVHGQFADVYRRGAL